MSERIPLSGLLGETLTGYLAALGVLRLLTEAGAQVRLGWTSEAPYAAWRDGALAGLDGLSKRLAGELAQRLDSLKLFPGRARHIQVPPDEYRAAVDAATAAGDRLALDLLTSLGSDAAIKPGKEAKADGKKDKAEAEPAENDANQVAVIGFGLVDPAWSLLNGAQQRSLFSIIRTMCEATMPPVARRRSKHSEPASDNSLTLVDRVRAVLEGPWMERDDKASLCLDPNLREHAYRWLDPTSPDDPVRSDGIANLFALIGLSLLPSVPVDQAGTVTLASACCGISDNKSATVSWPVWRGALALGSVRRLLVLPGLTDAEPPNAFTARGLCAVLRADIMTIPGANGAQTYVSPRPVWRA